MAQAKENERMEKIVSLCKRRGFIFQSSEIYGGINGFWDYGPLGAELKRNVKDYWWRTMTQQREDVVGLDASIIMHPMVWKASGHLETFSDPMSTCRQCKKLVRSDQIWPIVIESSWARAIAELVPGGTVNTGQLVNWAKGKGQRIAPNLALVRNPEVTISWISERIQKNPAPFEAKELLQYVATEQFNQTGLVLPCPHCGGELTEPRPFNLMFKTHTGPVESEENVAYLRPETAQAIFVQFKSVVATARQKVPFGICQIGKAFRNEITPRNFIFRSREFEQMELEFFIPPDEIVAALAGDLAGVRGEGHPGEPQPNWGWQIWHKYWVEERLRFYESIGLPRTSLKEYWQKPDELAHYAKATVDILFDFPFGTEELEGVAARGNFDLSQHEKFSGESMDYFDEVAREAWKKFDESKKQELREDYREKKYDSLVRKGLELGEAKAQAEKESSDYFDKLAKGLYTPHVIEPSAGVDRLMLALIAQAFNEEEVTDEKGNKETRVVMKFHPRIAPIKVGVFPLLKNRPELVAKALEVKRLLQPHMSVFYDDTGAIGRRYRRQDEAGTPFGVTIDFDTLGENSALKDTVTLRDRDTMKQERVKIDDLVPLLISKVR